MNKTNKFRKEAGYGKTDRDFIKYVLDCAKNITDNKEIVEQFGLIPPILQLFKLKTETKVYLEQTKL